jgi:transmembrane sensor
MKNSRNTKIDSLLSEQAAEWFVRVIANDLSLRERREYLAWLKESSRHVEALLDIYRYHGYGRKAKLNSSMFSDPDTDPGANVIPFTPRSGFVAVPQRREMRQRSRSRAVKVAAAVAGVVFTIVAGFVVKATYFDTRITTDPGEWSKKLLADGSVLRVGPNTRLRWEFDEQQRTVVLSEGEVVFDVAKDPQRPFIVTTQIGDVRAVGTQFGVSLMNGSIVVVTVAQGRVAVSKPNKGRFVVSDRSGAVAELAANQQLVMTMDKVEPVKQVDATHELQWATGYYEFRGETVNQAVVEFNRRNRTQVVVDDPAVGAIEIPFTTAQLNDPESFAVMLAARPDVRVAYEKPDVIRLTSE